MKTHTYFQLIILTTGTLLPLFWMIVILGHRRQRNFERVFFFLCLSLVFFFGGSLLAQNARLYYGYLTPPLEVLCRAVISLGLGFLPSLLIHLHVEYATVRGLPTSRRQERLWLACAYLPLAFCLYGIYGALRPGARFDFEVPSRSLGLPFRVWMPAALGVCAFLQIQFKMSAPDAEQKAFHRALGNSLIFVGLVVSTLHLTQSEGSLVLIAELGGLLPLVWLIWEVEKFNFLQIGRQRNLIYAVFVTFLALLYLSFVRRVSTWTEVFLPPEATAAILLFVPLIFFEPLQRVFRRRLRATAQSEVDRAQQLMGPILEVARLGNLEKLRTFIERWIREQLQLADVRLSVTPSRQIRPTEESHASSDETFSIRHAESEIGNLWVKSHGAMLSGETYAALQFACEQLASSIELCRLIEEKLELERELAERERLALVGQTAASISHNLKNPLGSIKTILQVQLESPEMPESMRGETKMVLDEISRLSAKLNQLLQFSRPAIREGTAAARSDARVVIEEAVSVLRPQAEKRGVSLKVDLPAASLQVAAGSEALNDIASNLLVNALEAVPPGGRVSVSGEIRDGVVTLTFEDDGPGIPESLREKILQPFFTTKSQGTGLGLAIVARRVAECGGKLDWESPVKNGKGTRFKVELPREEVKR